MGAMQPIVGALTGFVEGGAAMTVDLLDAAHQVVDRAAHEGAGREAQAAAPALAWLKSLAQIAHQVDALGDRAAVLSTQVNTASQALQDGRLAERGQAIAQAFEVGAQLAGRLAPTSPSLRWLPNSVRESLFGRVPQLQAGLSAAGELTQGVVSALPVVGTALSSAGNSFEQGAKLLKGIARIARGDLH